MEVKPAEKAALPIITFEHDVTVHLNGEDIRALHFPSGHTDGDAIIFFPGTMSSTWVTISSVTASLHRVSSGGSVQGMIDALEKACAQLPADVKVIPGHGALSNLDDVRSFVKMLKETSALVQKAIDTHKLSTNEAGKNPPSPGRNGPATSSIQTSLSKPSITLSLATKANS